MKARLVTHENASSSNRRLWERTPIQNRPIAIGLRILALFALLSAGPAGALDQPCTSSERCRDELVLSTGRSIFYYRNLPLVRNESVSHAVIVVHGNRRDADRYYERLVTAATAEDRMQDALLLAPNFRTRDDHPTANEHYWSSSGWKIGNSSKDSKRFSSFAAMNELLGKVCSSSSVLFEKLQTVVIIGHSAGGQFVNRYAAGGTGCPNRAVEVRYVVMNPSSYLYVDGRRKSWATGEFGPPGFGCMEYDDYKYGLRDLNTYMRGVGADRIRSQLFRRRTYYLGGEEDTKKGSSLDTSCKANLQGPNRLARYRSYREYAATFDDWTGATFSSVPGIGHSGGKMLMSEIARRIMFH
jgi:hypothetical protein